MSQDQSASAAPFISPEKEAANLALWLHIWETDPGFTKSFSRTGGFKGTATNPTWLQMRATAVFGPKGIGWGTTELAVRIEGHEHYEYTGEKGEVVQVPPRKVWFTHLEFWYVHPVSGERGKVDQWGGTEFMGSNKYGPFIDDEAAKKSATDAMSKCMAAIGFAADVHLGMFDDNKYVADLAQKFQPFRRRRAGGDKPKGNESSNNGNAR